MSDSAETMLYIPQKRVFIEARLKKAKGTKEQADGILSKNRDKMFMFRSVPKRFYLSILWF